MYTIKLRGAAGSVDVGMAVRATVLEGYNKRSVDSLLHMGHVV